jgi:hypothetical protein
MVGLVAAFVLVQSSTAVTASTATDRRPLVVQRVPSADRGTLLLAESGMSAEDWLDTIRVPLRGVGSGGGGGDGDGGPACTGVGAIEFEAGGTQLSPTGRQNLDGLVAALTAQDLAASRLELVWTAGPGSASRLTQRRLALIRADLRSHPSLTPERLTIPSKPVRSIDGCPLSVSPDTLLLQLRVVG